MVPLYDDDKDSQDPEAMMFEAQEDWNDAFHGRHGNKWTEDEKSALVSIVNEYGVGEWDKKALALGTGRSGAGVRHYYDRNLKPSKLRAAPALQKEQFKAACQQAQQAEPELRRLQAQQAELRRLQQQGQVRAQLQQQTQLQQQQQQAVQGTTVTVKCPAGVSAGQPLRVQVGDGREFDIVVRYLQSFRFHAVMR